MNTRMRGILRIREASADEACTMPSKESEGGYAHPAHLG